MGINFCGLEPRMSRDFLVKFQNESLRNKAYNVLSNIYVNNNAKLFGLIDKRKNELFVTLDYSMEISDKTTITNKNVGVTSVNLKNMVTLVAIKNGVHSDECFLFANKNFPDPKKINGMHCKNIFKYILQEHPKKKFL